MLPSSPPQSRPHTPSDYSLDLDALMPPDDSTGLLTPPRKNGLDVVNSEDIDGPTDFTQNMEYWMTAKLPIVTRPARLVGQAHTDVQDFVNDKAAGEQVVREASFVSGMSTAPSTPVTVERRRDFQASVEDHEDTPVVVTSVRRSSSAMGAALRSPELAPREEKADDDAHETISQLKAQLEKCQRQLDDVTAYAAEAAKEATERQRNLQEQLDQRQKQLDEIKTLNATVVQEARKERQKQARELEPRPKDVAVLREKITRYEDLFRNHKQRNDELEAQLAEDSVKHQRDFDEMDAKIARAAEEARLAVAADQASQSALQGMKDELATMHLELDLRDAEIDALKQKLGDALQSRSKHQVAGDSEMKLLETKLLETKLQHQKTLNSRAAKEILSLRDARASLQTRLEQSEAEKQKAQEALAALETQLETANETRLDADNEVDQAREDAKQARAESRQAREEVDAVKLELLALREDYEIINAEMDKRIKDLMMSRERKWHKRKSSLEKELGLRGKVLMRQWGEKELGAAEPQEYRYTWDVGA